MPLSAGTRLGPYEIIAPLGAGGMGEVFKARDTRLDRTVAIKILNSSVGARPEALQRFEREARAVSALNHANICSLYDVGSESGTPYLVMEYVEGETLTERLTRGPLPVADACQIAIAIGDALDQAHRRGIVHRDLKPGNVMLTGEKGSNTVKLLDFGLAKLSGAAALASGTPTSLPTLAQSLTSEGSIIGTFQYMAPEQLEGVAADHRSDIFAFGCVLYEMLTGRKAFEGKSQATLIAAIMTSEPPPILPWQPMSPPALDRVVRRCLAKDPDNRWQSARDLVGELRWITESGSQVAPAPALQTRRRARARWGWLAAGVLSLVVLAETFVTVRHLREKPLEVPVTRFAVSPPEGTVFNFARTFAVAVSPDGRRIAFAAGVAPDKPQLWVRSLDALAAQPLAGTEGAKYPFWSPDSKTLGFFADGKLKRIDASGGAAFTLCDAPNGAGGTWNREGVIVFTPLPNGPLFRVSAAGGVARPVSPAASGERVAGHRWPCFLPDGRHFLYSEQPAGVAEGNGAIRVASLDSNGRDSKLVLNVDSNAAYAQGYLLFVRETTLMAQPFDLKSLAPSGDAVPVAEQIQANPSGTRWVYSVSESGLLAYRRGEVGRSQLAWLDRNGKQIQAVGDPALFGVLHLSPDRRSAAGSITDVAHHNQDIWLLDVARGVRTRFTSDPAAETAAVWSPDGRTIVFNSSRKGPADLYRKASNGTGAEELLYADNSEKQPSSWSPDGRFLLYWGGGGTWVLPDPLGAAGDRKPYRLTQSAFVEINPQFSPDGRWVACQSNESGRNEIYVLPFPGPGGKKQISAAGGILPRWRPDGKEIFYAASDRRLMAAEVSVKGGEMEVGAVRPLFGGIRTGEGYSYDVSADGQKFLVITAPERTSEEPLTVIENWTAGLNR